MRKVIAFLLVFVVLSLLPSTTALAKGEKVSLCHPDKNGVYTVIKVAGKALQLHLAHGDLVVGVDEVGVGAYPDCAPFLGWPIGCFPIFAYEDNTIAYALTVTSGPFEHVGNTSSYSDADCTVPSANFKGGLHLIWAFSIEKAAAYCTVINADYTLAKNIEPYLYSCVPN
jgi:hypothetical protein